MAHAMRRTSLLSAGMAAFEKKRFAAAVPLLSMMCAPRAIGGSIVVQFFLGYAHWAAAVWSLCVRTFEAHSRSPAWGRLGLDLFIFFAFVALRKLAWSGGSARGGDRPPTNGCWAPSREYLGRGYASDPSVDPIRMVGNQRGHSCGGQSDPRLLWPPNAGRARGPRMSR
jgi:hypothetical protein